jgi:iron complex transport system permease protein
VAVVTDQAAVPPAIAGIADARARARRRMGAALVIALLAVAVAALATGPLAIAPTDYPAVAQALMVRFGWIDPAAVDISACRG